MFGCYIQLAELLVKLFNPLLEVVIHDLSSNKIIFIAGGLSKRKVGDDSLLDAYDYRSLSQVTEVYVKRGYTGGDIKSASFPIMDDKNLIGLMCFNFDISIFQQMKGMVESIINVKQSDKPDVLFKNDWQEKVHDFLYKTIQLKGWTFQKLTNRQKQELIKLLYHEGAFNEKKAPDYIAEILDMGRATIFNYLRQWRK